ncbi:MAG TPA: protease pro-enzyme activation domain-containing protein [Gaiellaceae bacterium]|jgi:photosystem II stability/assembly factor-like uncharacterized protein
MRWTRIPLVLGVVFATAALGSIVFFTSSGAKSATAATTVRAILHTQGTAPWSQRDLKGTTVLSGQVPLSVTTSAARYLGPTAKTSVLRLNFSLALRDRSTLDQLIALEAKTHQTVSRAALYARFAPPQAQIAALQQWLTRNGFTITHTGGERLSVGASAPVSTIERVLQTRINDYSHAAMTVGKINQPAFSFFANSKAPTVPARLGIQGISGLTSVDRFYTSVQLATGKLNGPNARSVRSGGYFGQDLRGLYDITGHGFDGTGQTVGFTLWTAAERQVAMTAYATATGDQPITVDANCVASGNSPTVPSSCSTQTVGADHLMTILENGNADNNWGSNEETGLDIEAAHGIATHVGMKYYASECSANPPANTGLANAGCNGSDVGMEMDMEDAANDPTLHSVSNSWGYGGDPEWGATDPFMVTTGNIVALAAAAGTTFYFGTGDSGTYESGYPTDSPYIVSVGGSSTWSTSTPGTWSTSTAWSGGGSWCSNIVARPSWQTGAGVTANASCPGRVSPDVAAIADPNTGINTYWTTGTTTSSHTQVGGTSLAAPTMNGLQAVTQNYVNAQTYPGATPAMGFVAPVLYQMGNSGHANSYFRDIECGNTANPTSGPDGDAAITGWDAATGWGEPDWFNFAQGYAIQLGATNVSTPASLSRNFSWTCAKTPSNSTERAFSCGTSSTCYAVGASSGTTPWYGKFLASNAWGAVNTFFKSTDGGQTWFPSNSDMFSIACTSTTTCIEVGAGGRERRTTDSGATWTDVATAAGNNKPLTQVTCPSSSICYAVGDRGNAMKSTDGGQTWTWLQSTDGNPIYGLSCPTTSVCYATDIYAHVYKTSDGGSTWTSQTTPITTPYAPVVAETGGPNPWGGMMGISCSDANTCVGVGIYASVSGQTNPNADPPIVTTTDGGNTWTRQFSNLATANSTTTLSTASLVGATNIKVASVTNFQGNLKAVVDSAGANPETVTVTSVGTSGSGGTGITFTPALAFAHNSGVTVTIFNALNYAHAVSCLPGTTTCTAVGRGGKIVTTTDLATWTPATSNTTNMLNSVTCLSTSFCMAVGQNGTVDVWNGTTWTATTGNGGTGMLASVSCLDASDCYATGKQGITIATTNGGGSWTIQAGGGSQANQMNGVSCPTANTCYAAGNAGTILKTTNGGQTWLAATSGTTQALNAISCASATNCVAVGAVSGTATVRYTTDGSTWSGGTGTGTNALNGVACTSSTNCLADGAAGAILGSADGGATWTAKTSGTTAALNAIACPSAGACYVVGAVLSGSAVIRKSTDGGTTWTGQTSSTANALSGVACTNNSACFADGAVGTTMVTTDGGATWTQQGNPISGPTTAINATGITLNGATCTSARCLIGLGAQGDIMMTPLVTVTVNTHSVYGTTPNLSGLAPDSAAISYSPNGEAGNVTGTLTCSTTATNTSNVGTYPVSSCTGLADSGFTIVYDYANSSHTVTKADQTITVGTRAPASAVYGTGFTVAATSDSGLAVAYGSSGGCSNTTADFTMTSGTTTCTVTYDQPGNGNYNAAAQKTDTVTAQKADQTITIGTHAPASAVYGTGFTVAATSDSGLSVTYGASGGCSHSGADVTMTSGTTDCTVTYDQGGNADYNSASEKSDSVTAQKADQTIHIGTHAPASAVYGTGFTVAATSDSGDPVTYGSLGGCSNSSGDFTMTSGSTNCTVTYDQAGNANYNAATEKSEAVTARKAAQVIHITKHAPGSAIYGVHFTVTASAGSGGGVTYSASGVCTNLGSVYMITGAGTCTVTYNQAGDSNYLAASQKSDTVAVKSNKLGAYTTQCHGTLYGTGYAVVVQAGKTCGLLPGTHIKQSITVQSGGTLYVNGVKIGGVLQSSGATTVCGSSVGRDVKATGGAFTLGGPGCAANTVAGNAFVTNDSNDVWVWGNTIHGSLFVTKDTGSTTSIVDNKLGTLSVTKSGPPVDVTGNSAVNMACSNNQGQTGSGNKATGTNSCPK